MAPAYAIPRLLARRGRRYSDIHLWEIHEAFAAQVQVTSRRLRFRRFCATVTASPLHVVNFRGIA